MPELPEVENFRRMLLPLVAAATASSSSSSPQRQQQQQEQQPLLFLQLQLVKENPPKMFLTPEQVTYLNNSQCIVQDIRRRGKLICMDLLLLLQQQQQQQPNGVVGTNKQQQQHCKKKFLFVHMGMTGRITTPTRTPCFGHATNDNGEFSLHGSIKQQEDNNKKKQQHEYPPKYTYLRFRVGNNHGSSTVAAAAAAAADACFSDPRKFGKVYLADTDAEFHSLSPDGLSEFNDPTPLIGLSTGIKAVLLDQKRVVSGVGNWVADEVLYQTEIHPNQTYLTASQAVAVQTCLVNILTTAVACLDANSEYPLHWLFHYRWAKKKDGVKDAKGRTIKFITSGGRTSAIIPSIQKIKKSQKSKPVATGGKNSRRVMPAKAPANKENSMKQKGVKAQVVAVSNPVNGIVAVNGDGRKRKSPATTSASVR